MTHNEQSEVKLEPCPFCGAQPKLIEIPVEVHYYVMCIECGACGSDLHGRQDAINAWNTRRASVVAPQGDARLVDREAAAGVAFDAVMATQGRCYSLTQIAAIVAANVRKIAASVTAPVGTGEHPIDMVLFCPRCGTQHVDAPEDETTFRHRMEAFGLVAEPQDSFPSRWTNPPHKSHLCHNCYAVWRPADVPTNGVAQIKTRGREDNTWTNSAAVPAAAAVTEAGEREPRGDAPYGYHGEDPAPFGPDVGVSGVAVVAQKLSGAICDGAPDDTRRQYVCDLLLEFADEIKREAIEP